MRSMPVIMLASTNRGKFEEFAALFSAFDLQVAPVEKYVRNGAFLHTVEDHDPQATYWTNAEKKCRAAFQAAKVPTFSDDSGIEIEALNGDPGVNSAHYGKPGPAESQDQANRRTVLEKLKSTSNRSARMRCVLVFQVEGKMIRAEGTCPGQIAVKETGTGGFGYDSIFLPEGGNGKSFAELSQAEKNKLSHRAKAVEHLVRLLKENEIEFVRP